MDPLPLLKACSAAALTLLVVAILGRLALRKISPQRQSTIIPLALAAGFFVGFALYKFNFPVLMAPKVFQTPLYVATIIGIAVALTFLLDFFPASLFFTVAAIVVSCFTVFKTIPAGSSVLAPWLNLTLMIAGSLIAWSLLQPIASRGSPALLVPLVLLIAVSALTFIVLYAVDQTTGKLLALTSALLTASCILALIPPTSHLVRGIPAFCITLLFVFTAIAAYYNPTIDNKNPAKVISSYVFFLPSLALLPALIGYTPFFGKRWWFSLPIAFLTSALLAAIPIYITCKTAPNPF